MKSRMENNNIFDDVWLAQVQAETIKEVSDALFSQDYCVFCGASIGRNSFYCRSCGEREGK